MMFLHLSLSFPFPLPLFLPHPPQLSKRILDTVQENGLTMERLVPALGEGQEKSVCGLGIYGVALCGLGMELGLSYMDIVV